MMEIKYLETTEPGLRWLRNYYRQNPELNFDKAIASLSQAEQVLSEFPQSGEQFEDFKDVREYQISGTAFSLLYTVARETIWIIDLRDTRGMRSAEVLKAFNTSLRKKYDL